MPSKVFLSPRAAVDLENILDHYQAMDKVVTQRYYTGFKKLIKQISKYPLSGRLIPELYNYNNTIYREIIFEIFRIIYRIEDNTLIIIRIIDQRQLLNL